MPTQVILDNDDATLWYYPEKKTVHHCFKRFIHGEEFRTVLEQGASAMEKYKATKWLSDDRSNGVLPPDDEKWGNQVWFPRVRSAGWKHWAIVQPEKAVAKLNMKRLQDTFAQLGINTKIFTDLEEAKTWLASQ